MKLIRFVLGIVLPPVGVFLTYGISTTLFINILLTFLGWIPGSIHGIWSIAKYYENTSERPQY
ncbi:MAG: YqaE/Pmp3 family membrane protein [Calothrix sp. MO_167.B42]|nr:YqaE/Pmp3 family membrane protein [Calothrix sp. MO_167.B42]